MNRTGGDDLDDDFVPDDLVTLSDVEDEEAAHSADGEDIAALLSADEGEETQASTSQVATEKKRKRRAKEKERRAKVRFLMSLPCRRTPIHTPQKKRKLAEESNDVPPPSVAAQSPAILADYLSGMQARTFSKMSAIELADIQIPG